MANKRSYCGTFFKIHYHIFVCLFLVISILTVYWQVKNFAFIDFDEILYITDNPHVLNGLTLENFIWAFKAKVAGNWHPLTLLSHMLDCHVYGLNPGGHHITNMLFHIVNTLLVFFIFWKMTGCLYRSCIIAALFALHPLHVESVAWVAERKDVLSTFFWLLTIWSYICYTEHPHLKRYLLSLLFFIFGLLAKPMLVTLPFALLLLDYWPLGRIKGGVKKRRLFRLLYEKIPFLALAAALSVITFLVQRSEGAVISLRKYSLYTRSANALVSYISYLWKMIFPYPLAFFYPHPGILPRWQVAGAFLLLLSASCFVFITVKKYPYFFVGWSWYIGTLIPVIGLIQVGEQAMADRYTYVPLIGIFIMIAWGIPRLVENWRYKRFILTATSLMLIAVFMILTKVQAGYWKNSTTLFEHALEVTVNNYVAHNNLGNVLKSQGKMAKAMEHYSEALRIRPDYVLAHNNIGNILKNKGEIKKALEHYTISLGIKPDYAPTYNNLGNLLQKQGKSSEAIEHYYRALQLKPLYADAHNNLGVAIAQRGNLDKAIAHFQMALKISPKHANAHCNLAVSLAQLGSFDKAFNHFQKAILIKPGYADAHSNFGAALAQRGNLKEAIIHFQKALQLKPDNAFIYHKLEELHKRRGELENSKESNFCHDE